MAEKRYYWLKLKDDYLNTPKIKKLRKIAGGDTYTIIYLKMQLLSIKNGGIIQFEGIEKTFDEELALKLDEDLDNVKITLEYLKSQQLIEQQNNEFAMVEAVNSIGSEGKSAERVRLFRQKQEQKMLQCNTDVTKCNIDIEKDKDIDSLLININKKTSECARTHEEQLKQKFNHFYEYQKTPKYVELADKVITALVEMQERAKDGLTFKGKDYNTAEVDELLSKVDDEMFVKCVSVLSMAGNVQNPTTYIWGVLINHLQGVANG